MSVVAAPAMAVTPTISSVGPGTLLGKGAAASVPITFVCDAEEQYSIGFGLQQRVSGKRLTAGSAQGDGICTGETQTATLQVAPTPYPYKKGTAAAFVTVFVFCSDQGFFCERADSNREIVLK